jgi:hypothetical protein
MIQSPSLQSQQLPLLRDVLRVFSFVVEDLNGSVGINTICACAVW